MEKSFPNTMSKLRNHMRYRTFLAAFQLMDTADWVECLPTEVFYYFPGDPTQTQIIFKDGQIYRS